MIRALEIPTEHADRLLWLERELVGPDLTCLVTELSALATGANPAADATMLIDDPRVLEKGLDWMSPEELEALIGQPDSLITLQRRVLAEGSAYWYRVAPPTDMWKSASIERTRAAIGRVADPDTLVQPVTDLSAGRNRQVASAFVAALATAAVMLLTVDAWRPGRDPLQGQRLAANAPAPPAEPGGVASPVEETPAEVAMNPPEGFPAWGFGQFVAGVREDEQQLAPPANRSSYLEGLAQAAEAWSNKRPDTRRDLVRRLGEFRMGCSSLLIADHTPLPEADRDWLRDRCRSWASAIDRHLASAESEEEMLRVRDRVDATVVKVAEALRARAETAPRSLT